jgi:thiol-disulfide isomerase/thioredoxin
MGTKEQIEDFLSKYPEYRPSIGLYNPEKDVIQNIRANLEDLEIKIFYGEWCPDCRTQLPRFLSVILALDEENIELEFIEVNRDKKDGLGKAESMNVLAVPTFIFLRGGDEIGRIIERPNDKMERDIAKIVS